MPESLEDNVKKNSPYLKLGDKETWMGLYIGWERVKTNFGKDAYRFTLEDGGGKRIFWDTGNMGAIRQFYALKKGDAIKIVREGIEKTDTSYTITKIDKDEIIPF